MDTASSAISRALNAAWEYQLLTFPNPAVGAVCFTTEGAILSVGVHKKAGGPHAEVYALRDAYTRLSGDTTIKDSEDSHAIHSYLSTHHHGLFHSVCIAVTLEPCAHSGKTPSCARLLSDLGIQTVYVSCEDPNPVASGGMDILRASGIKCVDGIMEAEGKRLLEPFLRWQNAPYVFFKWAQRLDGTIDNGTISSEASRKHMHALRDRCDLIVIGGNTVRMDRPTLDSRLVNGKAPDVLIYSREKEFDTRIPLFSVPDREVFIESTLERVNTYRLVMIEGGASMMAAVRSIIDGYVCYLAAKIGGGSSRMDKVTEEFEVLHAKINEDILLWMKRK